MGWWTRVFRGDPALPPVEAPAAARAYEGASTGRRFSDWQAGGKSANAEVSLGAKQLRERSRDLVRNNAYAVAALRALTTNIVGEGIVPRCVGPSPELSQRADQLWRAWASQASAVLPIGIYGLQTLMVRSWLESGEVVLRRRLRRVEDGLAVPLQVQILEADQLDGSREQVLGDSGARIVQGVEFDAIERIVAYWLLRSHPGESTIGLSSRGNSSIRVPSSDVAHLFEPTRPGQTRGIPWLTPGMRRFRELDSYEDAELMRKRVEACVSAFVSTDEEAEEGISAKVTDWEGNVLETLEPGTVAYLRGGKTITFNSPSSVGGYAEYKRAEIQSIAVAAGLTYELISGDLSQVNYSSIRAGLIEFRRLVRNLRTNFVIPMACDPIWRWFIEAGIASGALPLPAGKAVAEVYPVRWGAARFEEVDRAKEAKADLEELTSGVATYPEILARRGEDWIDVLDEHVRFRAEAEARDLVFPFMAPAPAMVGAPASNDVDEGAKENNESGDDP